MYTAKVFVIAIFMCIVAANARHHPEMHQDDEPLNIEEQPSTHDSRLHDHKSMRHRKKRGYNDGYNYRFNPAPPNPFYYPEQRDYDYSQRNLQYEILRSLDDLIAYAKRPPPPPQPIYLPYPVPKFCVCEEKKNKVNVPALDDRGNFPEMEDVNQNWGFEATDDNDDNDYQRPISLKPSVQKNSISQSNMNGKRRSQATPSQSASPNRMPGNCEAAIVSCCSSLGNDAKKEQCFIRLSCDRPYTSELCSKKSFNDALDLYASAYGKI